MDASSKLGNFIRRAADTCLYDGAGCCDALFTLGYLDPVQGNAMREDSIYLMHDMGMGEYGYQFYEFESGSVRQAVRHAWMYFVAQIADEWEA